MTVLDTSVMIRVIEMIIDEDDDDDDDNDNGVDTTNESLSQ